MNTATPQPQISQVPFSVPLVYANSFNISVTNSDVAITLMVSGQPFSTLCMSFNSAKSLAQGLQKSIQVLEKVSKQPILDTVELQKRLEPLLMKKPASAKKAK